MRSVNYMDLDINEKLTCVDIYLNKICPYEDFETLEDVEYSIKEFLKDTDNYIIDECGEWFEISVKRI